MKKQRFATADIIKGPDGLELRKPSPTPEHAKEMFEVLKRNDFFYPYRFSLRDCKSPDDCLKLVNARIQSGEIYYDIYVDGKYAGEISARDLDIETKTVNNLGYFVDKEMRGRGVATSAVLTLETELWKMGIRKIFLFCHYFDPKEINGASERVAGKCGYKFAGAKKKAIYDKWGDRWADEHLFVKNYT
ncbi:MAG: GNAT family N-acetyltransferase [Rickettsiales bacterium]|jgi:RimJ/RimL family protein N-acetyltransferase|nr:GNAT family N-acetyltransferase [Rickettsiales bacterium]